MPMPVTHTCRGCGKPCSCALMLEPPAADRCAHCVSRVFVLVEPSMAGNGNMPDTEPLALYAKDVQVLVRRDARPAFNTARVIGNIKAQLKDFNPDIDYLAAAGGGMLGAMLVGIALADLGVERAMWLVYQRGQEQGHRVNRGGYYEVRVLDFGQLDLNVADSSHDGAHNV